MSLSTVSPCWTDLYLSVSPEELLPADLVTDADGGLAARHGAVLDVPEDSERAGRDGRLCSRHPALTAHQLGCHAAVL